MNILLVIHGLIIMTLCIPLFNAQTCPAVDGRRGGNKCPCSYAKARCTIIDEAPEFKEYRDKDCNWNIKIDGKKAIDTGEYPKVTVQLEWELCNFNIPRFGIANYKIQLRDRYSHFRLWNRKEKNLPSSIYQDFDSSITLGNSPNNNCVKLTKQEQIDSKIGRWSMDASLQGNPIIDGVRSEGSKTLGEPFCYAYAFTPINIAYGKCDTETEVSCKVLMNGNVTNMTCQEFVDSKSEDRTCSTYEAELKWKACNKENRSVKIDPARSRLKFMKETIGRVAQKTNGVLGPDECEEFIQTRRLNTCNKVFYSLNLKGRDWDGTSEYPFIHKDCRSWSFERIVNKSSTHQPSALDPVYPPSATDSIKPSYNRPFTSAPSVSLSPNGLTSVSYIPTSSNKASSESPAPSVSLSPSGLTSMSHTPTSVSKTSSESPVLKKTTSSPWPSKGLSDAPSGSVEIHPIPIPVVAEMSSKPSTSSGPSLYIPSNGFPSSENVPVSSFVPSSKPSFSQKPTASARPSKLSLYLPSQGPSISHDPTLIPTISDFPSKAIVFRSSPLPSYYSSPSAKPSTKPSLLIEVLIKEPTNQSPKPSVTNRPSAAQIPSVNPTSSHYPSHSDEASNVPSFLPSHSLTSTQTPSTSNAKGKGKIPSKGKGGKHSSPSKSKGSRNSSPSSNPDDPRATTNFVGQVPSSAITGISSSAIMSVSLFTTCIITTVIMGSIDFIF